MPAPGYFAPTYFPPNYFPPAYFGSLGAIPIAPGGGGLPLSAYRDRDAFAAILNSLWATSEFAEVVFPGPLDSSPVGADRSPLVVVVPVQWTEQPDASSSALIRHVSYSLVVVARHEDPRRRFDIADRLGSIVQNTLEGSSLGGSCVPTQTQVRLGVIDVKSRHPELRVTLTGTFAYTIATPNSHDTTP